MKQTFITAISLQGAKGLEKGLYQPDGFFLEENIETSFPIIPIIKEQMRKKENAQIIVLRTENNDVKDNYQAFLSEVNDLGIDEAQVTPISIVENQSKAMGIATLIRIIDAIPEDSLVFADITFGTKPMSAIILYAMNFIEKLKDAEVDGIYYGELPREKGVSVWERAKLYDLTAFKYLQGVIESLNGLEVSDPTSVLKRLIEVGEENDQ